MNRFANNGEIADPCGVPRSRATSVPSGCCSGAFSHRSHVQQDPPLVGVVGDRLEHEVPGHGVEERPDVQIDHPVRSPAPLPARPDRVQRGLPRPVAVGVRMEDRFDLRLQIHPDHRLRDPVGHGRHAEHPDPVCLLLSGSPPLSPAAGNSCPTTADSTACTDSSSRSCSNSSIDCLVDARRTLVGLDPLKRLPDHPLGDLKRLVLRLRFAHPAPPGHAG